jgi:hypothetical protein
MAPSPTLPACACSLTRVTFTARDWQPGHSTVLLNERASQLSRLRRHMSVGTSIYAPVRPAIDVIPRPELHV